MSDFGVTGLSDKEKLDVDVSLNLEVRKSKR